MPALRSSSRDGWTGSQPNCLRVSVVEDGWSSANPCPRNPRFSGGTTRSWASRSDKSAEALAAAGASVLRDDVNDLPGPDDLGNDGGTDVD